MKRQTGLGTDEQLSTPANGGGGGGAVTIADGADVTQGSESDAAWVSGPGTVISLLKKIASAGGSAVSIADGSDVAEGSTADAEYSGSGSGTVISLLKKLVAQLAGSLTAVVSGTVGISGTVTTSGTATVSGSVSVSNFPATQPVNGTITANLAPTTSGGLSDYHVVSGASTNAANIKASAGQLYGCRVFNNATYPIYVKFHNTAGSPTPGSGVVRTIGIQAGTQRDVSVDNGIAFSTGIGITITKGIADNDTTAVAASDCVVDVEYK